MPPRPSPSPPGPRRALLLAAGLLAAATLAVYANSLAGPFVLDDEPAISGNPTIRQLGSALAPPHAQASDGGLSVSGRPLVNFSLALNYAAGGTAVRGYHTANLAIHLAAALVLFGVVRRTLRQSARYRHYDTEALPLAFAVALLWAVHPLQTEAVDYIVQRAESLMGLCYLLTLYAFIRATEPAASGVWSALAVGVCLAGMACKEVMVSAPLMVLLYDRTFVAGSFREAWRLRRGLHGSLAATWLLLGWLVLGAGDRGGTAGFSAGVAWWQYGLTQCTAIAHYLRLALWPSPLIFDYGTELTTKAGEVLPAALVLGALLIGTGLALWRCPVVGFAGAWFFAILAPSSSIVPVATQTVAEHRMYLPLAAVVALGVTGLHALLGRRALFAMIGLAVGLGLLTAQRNRDYRSAASLWQDTVAKRPGNARAHNSLGTALLLQGRAAEAAGQFEQALRINPDYGQAHNNLGVALVRLDRVPEAIVHYEMALRLNPADGDIPHNLGDALIQAGRVPEAEVQYERALRLRPDLADVQDNSLGGALLQLGQSSRAIELFEAALRARPDFAEAHVNLGQALARTGRLSGAIEHYEAALRIQPDDAETHFNAGNALLQSGRLPEAMDHYGAALHLKPDFAEAHANLGAALLQAGRREEAIRHYREALRLEPGLTEAQATLLRLLARPP
jgi:tetratricopeptide (TPR) repeat protein